MFGFTDERQDFIIEYNGIILAMLIPWCIKKDKCFDLVVEINEIIQKDMATMLTNAFLPIYLHLHLYESEDVRKKGMEFLLQNADNSLYGLFKSDIKVSSFQQKKIISLIHHSIDLICIGILNHLSLSICTNCAANSC